MENIIIEEVHISQIKSGDTIMHQSFLDKEMLITTVCDSNIKIGGFMGDIYLATVIWGA